MPGSTGRSELYPGRHAFPLPRVLGSPGPNARPPPVDHERRGGPSAPPSPTARRVAARHPEPRIGLGPFGPGTLPRATLSSKLRCDSASPSPSSTSPAPAPSPPPPTACPAPPPARSRASPSAWRPSLRAWLAALRGSRVSAAVPRSRSPSRCDTAPASTAGIMRRMAKGTKVAMTSSAPPASTAENPAPCGAVARRARRHGAGGQAQGRHDDELRQDERRQRLDQAAAPVRHGRPDQRGQGQGQGTARRRRPRPPG